MKKISDLQAKLLLELQEATGDKKKQCKELIDALNEAVTDNQYKGTIDTLDEFVLKAIATGQKLKPADSLAEYIYTQYKNGDSDTLVSFIIDELFSTDTILYQIERCTAIAEKLEWSVDVEVDYIEFRQYSRAGRDFSFTITYDANSDIASLVKEAYDDFDVSYETYIWLDNTGHGSNGAPYEMEDILNDSKEIETMIETLADALSE